jgi:hypothetical protein
VHLYWCFVDFEKAFGSVHREALWYRLRRNGISDKIVKCNKEGVNFCEKCGEGEVMDFIEPKRGVG